MAELGEDLVGVLTPRGRRPRAAFAIALEAGPLAWRTDPAHHGVIALADRVTSRHLRIGRHLVGREHGHGGDVGLVAAAQEAPGHVRTDLQPPDDVRPGEWTIVYQFRAVAYEGSDERVDEYEQPVFAWR